MKHRLFQIALLVAVSSSAAFAGPYSSSVKELSFFDAIESERRLTTQSNSYDLIWDDASGKFEAHLIEEGESILLNKPQAETSPVPELDDRALAI